MGCRTTACGTSTMFFCLLPFSLFFLSSLLSSTMFPYFIPLFDVRLTFFPFVFAFSLSCSRTSLLFVSLALFALFSVVVVLFFHPHSRRQILCLFRSFWVKVTFTWVMCSTVRCLPLTLVLSLSGVDSATFFGFPPDAALVRVTFDIEQEVLFCVLRMLSFVLVKMVLM